MREDVAAVDRCPHGAAVAAERIQDPVLPVGVVTVNGHVPACFDQRKEQQVEGRGTQRSEQWDVGAARYGERRTRTCNKGTAGDV